MIKYKYMYKNIFKIACIPLLFSILVLPASAAGKAHQNQMNPNHQSNLVHQYKQNGYYYAPQDQQIAYLYSMIAQLQAELALLKSSHAGSYPYTSGSNTATREISRIVTGGVDEDNNDSVVMDGEVTFARDTEARVWFEYGTNTNLSYSTESVEVNGDRGDTEDFELTASDLDDNKTYYYRAVAEDTNGNYAEGVIKSFRFDGRSSNNNNDNNNDDWSLDVADDSYDTGDTVRVDYTVDDQNNKNWIGLYEVGDSDKNYVSLKYIKDDEGSVSFRINNDGEYEFRLFSDNTFDKQATSDGFEVND